MTESELPDAALYEREYALRQILDKEKTPEQLAEVTLLKQEIRRRFAIVNTVRSSYTH